MRFSAGATFGWAVVYVFAAPEDPDPRSPFAYTVGLTADLAPELVITGLDPATSQALLNDLAALVHDHSQGFRHGQRISNLLAGYDAVIIDGHATDIIIPGAAVARYGAAQVHLKQNRLVRPGWSLPLGVLLHPRPRRSAAYRRIQTRRATIWPVSQACVADAVLYQTGEGPTPMCANGSLPD
jgi:hypothetical protein